MNFSPKTWSFPNVSGENKGLCANMKMGEKEAGVLPTKDRGWCGSISSSPPSATQLAILFLYRLIKPIQRGIMMSFCLSD